METIKKFKGNISIRCVDEIIEVFFETSQGTILLIDDVMLERDEVIRLYDVEMEFKLDE